MNKRKASFDKCILIVEDDQDHIEVIRRSFNTSLNKYDLKCFSTIHEAQRWLEKNTPNLAIIDWKFESGGSGTDLLPGYGKKPTYPVIVMTSYGSEELVVDVLKKGAIDFIVKRAESLRNMRRTAERAMREWDQKENVLLDEERLKRASRLAELGSLAGSIAHELKNLIGAVQNYGEIIRDDIRSEVITIRTNENIDKLLNCVDSSLEIISKIRNYSQQLDSQLVVFDIGEKIQQRIDLLKPIFPKNVNIDYVDKRTDSRRLYFESNPDDFQSIIMNLVTNAREAMPERGGDINIELETRQVSDGTEVLINNQNHWLNPGYYHLITVADTGKGMSKDTLDLIFEPFFTQNKKHGTGLGLPTVKNFVSQREGMVWAESQYNKGSKFFIMLPCSEKRPDENVHPELPIELKGNGQSILLIDDQQSYLDSTKQSLEALGYRVTVSDNSVKLLNQLKRQYADNKLPYDLLITDQLMPELKGYDLYLEIKKLYPELPAILMTGYGEIMDEYRARRAGFKDFWEKGAGRKAMAESLHDIFSK